MPQASHQIVRDFFAALPSGSLPDTLLAPDMCGWSTLQGSMDRATYLGAVKMLGLLFNPPVVFTIKSITAEEDRAVAEVESAGTLINGETYGNTYVFVFRIRDGRIASVAEHFNALVVREKLTPAMQMIMSKNR